MQGQIGGDCKAKRVFDIALERKLCASCQFRQQPTQGQQPERVIASQGPRTKRIGAVTPLGDQTAAAAIDTVLVPDQRHCRSTP